MVHSSSFKPNESTDLNKTGADHKENVFTEERRLSAGSQSPKQAWNPSWFQVQPLLGLLALLVAVGAMFTALVVLLVSNGQRVSSWGTQPTVYLAIASAVGVSALRFAKGRATPISWWHEAYQGNTIRHLESHWEAGQGLIGAIKYFKYARWMSCSTVLYLLMIIDGAMLQRASRVIPTTVSSPVSLKLQLSPELPTGFAGFFINNTQMISNAVTQVTTDYLHGKPMLLAADGCDDSASCNAKVLGPGAVMQNCQNQTWRISQDMMHSPNATWGIFHGVVRAPDLDFIYNSAFFLYIETSFSQNSSERETGVFYSGRLNVEATGGEYTWTKCGLVPAILEYEVQLSGGQVTLTSPEQGKLVSLVNNTGKPAIFDPISRPSTYSSFYQYLDVILGANASAAFPLPSHPGDYWSLAPWTMDEEAAKYFNFATSEGKGLHFRDPSLGVLGGLNEMLFRGGIIAGSWTNTTKLIDAGLSTTQTVKGKQELKENVYSSNLNWFAGAAILDLLAMLSILPLFWGFWRIPRGISQSPFNLALAFNAPLLEGVHSTAGARGVVDQKGDLKVAFGLVQDQPVSFVAMEESQYGSQSFVGRLGIGKSRQVMKPQVGTAFV